MVAPVPSKQRPTPAQSIQTRPNRPATRAATETGPRSPAVEALSRHTSELMAAAADTLCLSCLYFTRENLDALGSETNIATRLEKLDPVFRAALMDGQTNIGEGARFLVLVECRNELYAGVESARLAAQIFSMLRDSKLPASGLHHLRNVTDAAARAIRAAGTAVASGEPEAGRTARAALAEAEKAGKEYIALIPSLPDYRSRTLCRVILASLYSVLVSAQMLTEVAVRLTLPDSHDSRIGELKGL